MLWAAEGIWLVTEENPPSPQPYPQTSGMPDESPESELLVRLSRADDSAFREVVQRHGRYLHAIARSLTSNVADAEDVVQEAFMSLLTAKLRGEASLRTFLVAVLIRRAALLRRKRKPWMRLAWTDPDGGDEQAPVPVVSSSQGAVDARLDVAQLLQQVSPEHREVLILRELEGLSYEEIAEALSIPKGTVESRLYRARDSLQRVGRQSERGKPS